MKSFTKGIISTVATIAIVSGAVYAANTIGSVASQTIGAGDTMGQGWFQQVNDHVLANTGGGGNQYKFGGAYNSVMWKQDDPSQCWNPNPITGNCSCPAGYTPIVVGQSNHYSSWDGIGFVCLQQ